MKLTPVVNFIKLFCVTYTTVGISPKVLTQVMPLGAYYAEKGFMKLTPVVNFMKLCLCNLCCC